MKKLGFFALVIGVLWVVVAFNTDVSVDTGYGRVNNIGLMASRQNHIIIGGLIVLVGVLMLIFGKGSSSAAGLVKCPFCAELIQGEAIKCKHCGSDIQPHAKSQEPDSTLWAADNYFKLNNGDVVIEQGAIDTLSISLIGLHPSQSPKDVYEKYKAQIRTLSNELPPQIRDSFRQTVKSKF